VVQVNLDNLELSRRNGRVKLIAGVNRAFRLGPERLPIQVMPALAERPRFDCRAAGFIATSTLGSSPAGWKIRCWKIRLKSADSGQVRQGRGFRRKIGSVADIVSGQGRFGRELHPVQLHSRRPESRQNARAQHPGGSLIRCGLDAAPRYNRREQCDSELFQPPQGTAYQSFLLIVPVLIEITPSFARSSPNTPDTRI